MTFAYAETASDEGGATLATSAEMSAPEIRALERVLPEERASFAISSVQYHSRGELGGLDLHLSPLVENTPTLPEFELVLFRPENKAIIRIRDTNVGSLQTDLPYFSPRNSPALRWFTAHVTQDSLLELELALFPEVQPRVIPGAHLIRIYFSAFE